MSSNRRASFPVNALRRSPRKRTKTPSVNELSKKCKLSPRGKRRLEFQQEKPLKGRTFYLDLQGYRKTSSLQARIKELGGAIEEFLSKDISFVVTNKKDADTRCSPRSNSTPSPILSVPSPFPGNTKSSSAKGSAVPSPLSADSCGAEQAGPAVPKHDMRGKALAAQAAITYKYGTSNLMANARNWGVQIVPLEKMLEKLEKYGSVEKKPTSKPLVSGRVAKQGIKPKVRKLYAPFIKVEDHSRAYKPLVHELKEWPKIHFDGPLGGCPFDSPKKDLENENQEQARTKRKATQEDKNKKKGFCECCCIHYEDLDMHLVSDRHQSFARDSSNYRSLDELINKGPSLQDFLAKMLLKHEQKEKEKQEKDSFRGESPSTGNSLVDRDEEKTPTKKNRHGTLPNCETPPDQTPTDCHTPINPSPERRRAFRTPTNDFSPGKKSTGDNTPTRVLRPRGGQAACEVEMVETRQLRSSPRLSNSLNEKNSPGNVVDIAEGEGVKKKRLSLEKTSDETSVKRTSRAITHSTWSSSVGEGPRCGKGAFSPSQEELIHQSLKNKPAEGKKRSPVQNVDKKSVDVRARARQQDSSDESSGKENHDPESLVDCQSKQRMDTEENVTGSRLRSGATRVTQQHADEGGVESHADAQGESEKDVHMESPKRTSLRSAAKGNIPDENQGRVDSREANVQEDLGNDIHLESLKRTSLRSARNATLTERCRENGHGVESPKAQVQEKPEQDIQMESPKRKSLGSAAKANLRERCSVNEDRAVESPKVYVQENSKQDIHMESPKKASLRSATKENLSEHCSANEDRVECPKGHMQEEPEQDIEMESPKRKSLRSTTKGNLSEPCSEESESKNTETPQTEDLDSKRRMRSSPPATKQPLDEITSAKETKANETSLGNREDTMDTVQQDNAVRLTRSRMQSAPTSTTQSCNDSDITEKTKSFLAVTQKSTGEEDVERKVRSRDRSVSTAKRELLKSARLPKVNTGEAAKTMEEHETSQGSKRFSRGSEAVPVVEVKLSDCRQLCLTHKRPVLENESDESETESIQLSSAETLSKKSFSDNASTDEKDDDDDNDISSTPTLENCPSPASSEKSGFSDETASARRYGLRKRTEQEDQDPCPGKRTRTKYKIPNEDSKKGNQDDRQRRKTVSSAFTSVKVKSRSPKQWSQSVISPKRKTPEKKLKGNRGMKIPLNNTPRRRTPKLKDPTSESDSSTFSGSPQSGPIRESRSTHASMVHSAVRNLEETAVEDTDNAKETLLLSDSVLSLGDISTTAVCGSPSRLRPAAGKDSSFSGIKLLNGSPRIKKDFHSVTCLDKHRKQRAGITRLFESDDEEEEFVGFNVPHFDRSFSSEGDLSYKIDSILESIKGDDSQGTIEDDGNSTIHEGKEEVELRKNVGRQTEADIERSEISWKGQCGEKDVENDEEIKQVEATRVTRKRKLNQIDSVEEKRSHWSESQGDLRSTAEPSCVIDNSDNDGDDFDEDDDVFSTVADSTDGEEDEQEVSSPLSITSWRRKRKSGDLQPGVDGGEDEVASSLSFTRWGRKRKSEDLQAPEVERPTKRRKSQEGPDTDPSSQSSRPETPVKSGANQGIRTQNDDTNQRATCFTSKLDELLDSEQGKKAQSSLFAQDSDNFYDSDKPVYQTIEERVKLRRIMNISRKEYENSRSHRQAQDHRKLDNTEIAAKGKTEERKPPLKPLRKQTYKPLKPLKNVSPIRSSSRLRRTNSSPSPSPSPLATPSGKSRRATWIYDVNEFTSPPSTAPRSGGNRVTCSTPASTIPSSKRTLRPLGHSLPRKSRQKDVFAFDE